MEPYYTLAERMYCVHGARGEDPTEPPASGDYPFPAVSHEPRIQQLSDDLAALGHHPFHAPCGVLLNEADMPYSTCMRCEDCDGFPCLLHAKSDAEVLGVRPALEHDNVELMTDAEAVRLTTGSSGRTVAGVQVEHGGTLRDADRRHRRRLLRGGELGPAPADVGRRAPSGRARQRLGPGGAQLHVSQLPGRARPLKVDENPTVFQKTLGLNDFYLSGPDTDYPLGNIQMVGKSQAPMFRGEKPIETLLAPARSLEDVARHAVDFWLSTEDLPLAENRVTVDAHGTITLAYRPTNDVPKQRLYAQLKSMLAHIGMEHHHLLPRHAYLKNDIPVAGCAHQAGTCRFGADPATSVLDVNCKAHELDNLYVVDTSFFPSIGAVNPALTAMANALRVGDHLRERLGAAAPAEAGVGAGA